MIKEHLSQILFLIVFIKYILPLFLCSDLDLTMERNLHPIDSRYESHEPDDPGNWPDNIVTWHGEKDPNNPMNWPIGKKIRLPILLGITTMGASFASSSFSPTFNQVAEEFGVSTEVATLSLSLYVLGFAFGPLVKVDCSLVD